MASEPDWALPARIEWPTVCVAVAIYAGFGLLTWFYEALPWWLVVPLGGYVVAWHGSLQHEAVHGHPTPWPAVNEASVLPSLWLWLPFRIYRESHLAHHSSDLTDPLGDPESFYVTPDGWSRLGRVGRALLWAHNSLAGRLVLGPPLAAWRLLADEARRLARGDSSHGVAWVLHLGGSALVLVWALWVCRVPLFEYLAFFVYPGVSLTLLRSFLEHRASPEPPARTVVVESSPVLSLMFLNNNLHVVHHDEPGTAWYRLPARYRERRSELLARNGGYLYRGYAQIAARYLLRAKEHPAHPLRAAQA